MKTSVMRKQFIFPKILLSFIMVVLPIKVFAEIYVQPIIHGKLVKNWQVNLKTLPKPKKVIKGGEDECNGGNLPDEFHYPNLTVQDNGRIQEVIINDENGLIFHKQRIVEKMNQQKFTQKFKTTLYRLDEDNPNSVFADLASDGNDTIEFIFKSGQLYKYRLNFDDC